MSTEKGGAPPHRLFWRALVEPFLTAAGLQAATNLFWLGFWTALASASSVVSLVVLTRSLGADRYGVLVFGLTLQSYLQAVGALGLRSVVVREGVRRPAEVGAIAGTYLGLSALGGSGVLLASWGALGLVRVTPEERLLLALLAVSIIPSCLNWQPLFDLRHRQPHGMAAQALAEVMALVAVIVAGSLDALSLGMVGAVVIGKAALTSLAQWWLWTHAPGEQKLVWSPPLARTLLSSAWPLLASGLVGTVPLGTGIFFLRASGTVEEVAVLGVAQQLVQALLLFGGLGVRIVEPHIAGPYGYDRRFIKKLAIFGGLYLGGSAVVTWILSAFLTRFFLAPAFEPLPPLFAEMAVATCILLFSTVGGIYLVVLGRERAIVVINILAASSFCAAALALVPPLSFRGVALSLLLSSVVSASLVALSVRRELSALRRNGSPPAP